MPALSDSLRSQLEKTVVAARDAAEEAARAALESLGVARDAFFPGMTDEQKSLRRALRAKAAQLGGQSIKAGGISEGWDRLVEEIAYEGWHRMLFARVLAENHLLMHPEGVPVTLEECEELASEEGAADGWELAARYAGAMLPGLFHKDDPAVQIRFAPEGRRRLETLLTALPSATFTADDSLGWVYQFWQSKKKEEVNRSERKIGGADLYPVTQLFTEDYMVQFLLQNSLGAWWAARHPESPLIQEWEYLRWQDEVEGSTDENPQTTGGTRTPAAGTFPGWPDRIAEVTMMDPCGGSGHFIVAGFEMMRRMRMEEEGLSEAEAADAVIRDNVFMLEIDPRCTQIATFALALAAWKAGGYRTLSTTPNIACSGIPIEGQLDEWLRLAGDDAKLHTALERLYHLFKEASTLGSLINPTDVPVQERMFSADYHEVAPLLEAALDSEQVDPAAAVLGDATRGVLKAAQLLAGKYTLVATNVPYLGRGAQNDVLRNFCAYVSPRGKQDLATVFLERLLTFCTQRGTTTVVLPQNWLFLSSYEELRKHLLFNDTWNMLVRLGPGAFKTISGEVVKAILLLLSQGKAPLKNDILGLDVSALNTVEEKASALISGKVVQISQSEQRENPGVVVSLQRISRGDLLGKYASSHAGLDNGDSLRFRFCFWEMNKLLDGWIYQINAPTCSNLFGGREHILKWENGKGALIDCPGARLSNIGLWGSNGVYISRMSNLPATLCLGTAWDRNGAMIIPKQKTDLPALWAFCSSESFSTETRKINQKLSVAESAFEKVPFDFDYWQSVAEEQYPDGLPKPWSNDPTQWLFQGHPVGSTEPLHVAAARLLGYNWPENATDDLAQFADVDGIVCIPAVAGEQPAHERLRSLLAHAYSHPPELPDFEKYRVGDYVPSTPVAPDAGWSSQTEQKLLAHAESEGKDLEYWLRYKFFVQHCRLFGNRPFLWHIWDGRNDGFAAIVNYHKLNTATLDKLIYTYLGSWINDQRAAVGRGEAGADARLAAAQELKKKLEAIREGEPPYDIYVRWKALYEQPLGWQPDLNDGVRQNIRPFVEAGILRRSFSINWSKDRGKNPDGSERQNDLHFTRAQKQAARQKLGVV